jgi:hypothetical protein
MNISAPNGRRILAVDTKNRLEGYGLTELFSESSEPSFDEFPLRKVKRLFPEGATDSTGQPSRARGWSVARGCLTTSLPAPDHVARRRRGSPGRQRGRQLGAGPRDLWTKHHRLPGHRRAGGPPPRVQRRTPGDNHQRHHSRRVPRPGNRVQARGAGDRGERKPDHHRGDIPRGPVGEGAAALSSPH